MVFYKEGGTPLDDGRVVACERRQAAMASAGCHLVWGKVVLLVLSEVQLLAVEVYGNAAGAGTR
jgi:hypothetical protein